MFDIHARPPRADAIFKWRRRALIKAATAGLVVAALLRYFGIPETGEARVLLTCVLFMALGLFLFELRTVEAYFDVPDEACSALLAACLATAEGQAYRQAVLAEGRKFVNAEWMTLDYWARGAEQRATCKQLYDIAK
jgi:Zn-dependent membrane protease YugP